MTIANNPLLSIGATGDTMTGAQNIADLTPAQKGVGLFGGTDDTTFLGRLLGGSSIDLSGAGDAIGGMFGKLGEYGKTPQGMATAGLVMDAMKRQSMLPVLEAEAMFKAFGRGGLTDTAKQGIVGQDVIGTLAKADAAAKLEERNKQRADRINALLDRIEANYK